MFYRVLALAISGTLISIAAAQAACSSYPYTLTNGTTADASQVMSDFNCAALTGSPTFSGAVTIASTGSGPGLDVQSTGGNSFIKVEGLAAAGGAYLALDRWATTGNSAINFYTGSTTDFEVGVSPGVGTSDFVFYDDGTSTTPLFIAKSTAYVGINTSAPGYQLHVNGTAYATGAAGALSDIRHKKDVATLVDGALDDVMRLRPVRFLWKDPKDDGMKGRQMGFIAQELGDIARYLKASDGELISRRSP